MTSQPTRISPSSAGRVFRRLPANMTSKLFCAKVRTAVGTGTATYGTGRMSVPAAVTRTPARQRRCFALVLAIMILATGCSGRARNQNGGGGSTASTTGPATTADPSNAVLAAYRAHWADVIEAGKTADWRSPRLDDHATGEVLKTVRANYRRIQADGEVVRGTVRLHPRVVSVQGSTAIIRDCNDVTDFLRYDAKTGAPREERKTDIAELEATLRLVNGHWLVSKTTVKGPCTP
jgi:hypothetical protein